MTSSPTSNQGSSINSKIVKDFEQIFKDILSKHLAGREINEDYIYSWLDNILIDSKEYFRKKYPDCDIFIEIFIGPMNMNFYSSHNSNSNHNRDLNSYVVFTTDTIYSRINYFCY